MASFISRYVVLFQMLTSRHYALNTALVFRVNEGAPWLVGHVVGHQDGNVKVLSDTTEVMLVPGSDNMKPLGAILDGLTVLYRRGKLHSGRYWTDCRVAKKS